MSMTGAQTESAFCFLLIVSKRCRHEYFATKHSQAIAATLGEVGQEIIHCGRPELPAKQERSSILPMCRCARGSGSEATERVQGRDYFHTTFARFVFFRSGTPVCPPEPRILQNLPPLRTDRARILGFTAVLRHRVRDMGHPFT